MTMNKIVLLKDYIKVNQGEMSQMFFCKKHNVEFRKFTEIAYVIEADLETENERLKKALKRAKKEIGILAHQIENTSERGFALAEGIVNWIEQALSGE